MRYLKSFVVFESVWSAEEFVSDIIRYLSEYKLSEVYLRELISNLDIESMINSGKSPLIVSKEIISDLGLDQSLKGGYSSFGIKSVNQTIKYL